VGSPPPDLASLSRTLFHWARQDRTLKVIPAVERELIINALAETNGNQVQAAKLLGITRATLRKRVEKFHIKQELSIR
jgi:two-component system nitrogen regulation response regulator GlnG